MARRGKISNKTIVEVYSKKAGNLTATASSLGLARKTLERWRESDSKLAEMLNDIDESLIDYTESKLMESINEGNVTSILFFLKTKGKKRGYVEQNEVKLDANPFIELLKGLPDND